MQEKLEEQANNSDSEILEEQLKLVESELQGAVEKAEKAEQALQAAVERAEKAEQALQAPPPAPPLPPPPPPPPNMLLPPTVPLRTKKVSRTTVPEIAATLGVEETMAADNKKSAVGGVNDDIINQIKGGKFTLRKAKNEGKKERDTPKAVSELLNILGSLRRAPKNRASLKNANFGDVQL